MAAEVSRATVVVSTAIVRLTVTVVAVPIEAAVALGRATTVVVDFAIKEAITPA